MKPTQRNIIISLLIVVAVISLDQISKSLAELLLKYKQDHVFLFGTVHFQYSENPGAFLSLGADLPDNLRFAFFVGGVSLLLSYCAYSIYKHIRHIWWTIGFSLIFSGGIGNLIDRAARGRVIDFVHMGFGDLRTGIFNIADLAISSGVVLIFLLSFREKKRAPTNNEAI